MRLDLPGNAAEGGPCPMILPRRVQIVWPLRRRRCAFWHSTKLFRRLKGDFFSTETFSSAGASFPERRTRRPHRQDDATPRLHWGIWL